MFYNVPTYILNLLLRAQVFTSLKADVRQDINEGMHLTRALMEHFLEGIAVLTQMRKVTNINLLALP